MTRIRQILVFGGAWVLLACSPDDPGAVAGFTTAPAKATASLATNASPPVRAAASLREVGMSLAPVCLPGERDGLRIPLHPFATAMAEPPGEICVEASPRFPYARRLRLLGTDKRQVWLQLDCLAPVEPFAAASKGHDLALLANGKAVAVFANGFGFERSPRWPCGRMVMDAMIAMSLCSNLADQWGLPQDTCATACPADDHGDVAICAVVKTGSGEDP